MATEYTVQNPFPQWDIRIAPAINIHNTDAEGVRSATALVDGQEVPIQNRPEWDFLWYEQEQHKTDDKFSDNRRATRQAITARSKQMGVERHSTVSSCKQLSQRNCAFPLESFLACPSR